MAEKADKPGDEEAASFRFGGTRARPRKGIEAVFKTGETYLKPPGSCKGRWPKQGISVEVECCRDCNIYVLDTCDQVQIADCVNCRVIVGPCTGSLFLLDCTGCTFAVAGKQIRCARARRDRAAARRAARRPSRPTDDRPTAAALLPTGCAT